MIRLRPVLPYDRAETTLSYLGRLAAVHTGLPARQILTDLGIDRAAYLAGREPAIAHLATATGIDPEMLARGAITIAPRFNDFRGAIHSKDFLSPCIDRICPECLKEDGRAADLKHRLLWCYRMAGACPVHGVALVGIAAGKETDLRAALEDRWEIVRSEPTIGSRKVRDHVRWLDARLRFERNPTDWTVDQTSEQVLAASEILGAVLDHGPGVRMHCLDEDEREGATETGFSVYRAGPRSLRDAISRIRDRTGIRSAQAGPRAMYGRLYDWLNTRSSLIDPGPIRSILRDHIMEHSAVESGESVLGEVVETRRFHSLGNLSGKTGISTRKLLRLLQKRGFIAKHETAASSGTSVFPVEEVEQLCADLEKPVFLQDVAEHLSASRNQVTGLYAAGVLQPIFPADTRGEFKMVSFGSVAWSV